MNGRVGSTCFLALLSLLSVPVGAQETLAEQPPSHADGETARPTEAPSVSSEPATAAAQPETPAPEEPEEDLGGVLEKAAKGALNRETTVASSASASVRDSPALITVVTRDEIRRSGARDLMDVLHLVAGFSFGTDVQGSVGPIFRGLWGQEGKVLVLWDGFEMNETMYLSTPIENHFPVQSIERIEVIRGPGSAVYGGFAALAVINIVTRQADTQGIEQVLSYGQMWRGFGRANGEIVYGQRLQDGFFKDLELSLNVFGGEAARSDRDFSDGYGTTFHAGWENASQGQTWFQARAAWKGFDVRLLLDANRIKQRDGFGEALAAPVENSFYGAHVAASYTANFFDVVEFAPRLYVKRMLPWYSSGAFFSYQGGDNAYHKIADRARVQVPLRFKFLDGMMISTGFDGYLDQGTVVTGNNGFEGLNTPFENGEAQIVYWNVAAYAEYSLTSSIVNLTAGARYEFHNAAGSSFVPRFALTKSFDKLWMKGLLSGAFKPPGIENFTLAEQIVPENATVYEAEVGYDILPTTSLSISLFRVELTNPIVFFVNEEGNEAYQNFDRTGSQGADIELRMLEEWGSLTANYSFANSVGLSNVPLYNAGGATLRGAPEHKFAASGRFNVTPNASIGPTLVVMTERRGWLGGPDNVTESEPPAILASVTLFYRDLLLDGLDATLAVHNILDTEYRYIQPYDGGHAPLPTPGREVFARLSYRFGL
jgi:outer membrane receptor for ferrienterochelin and colicin